MGWLSWLFPSAEDHVEAARRFLEQGDPLAAWRELEGVEGPDAEALMETVNEAVVRSSLEQARRDLEVGGYEVALERAELASRFSKGRFDEEVRDLRRQVRERRSAEGDLPPTQPQAQPRARDACASGSCGIQPAPPGPVEMPSPGFGADPIFSLPPDDPRVRYAMLLESCPEALRARYLALGPEFAEIVLGAEEGRAREAVDALGAFVEKEPAARFQRAVAALEAGVPRLAEEDLRRFTKDFGHIRVGVVHTAVALARLLAAQRRAEDALEVLAEARRQDAKDLELIAVTSNLQESLGRLEEAEDSISLYLRAASRDLGAWKILARIRVRRGDRIGAMQALDSALTSCCKGPARCGSQPLDLQAARMLAQLYLEDRLEPERAEELLAQITDMAETPDWMDGYLQALRARNRESPDLRVRVEGLLRGIPSDDPRRGMVQRAFEGVLRGMGIS